MGRQLKQSVNVFHNFTVNLLLPSKENNAKKQGYTLGYRKSILRVMHGNTNLKLNEYFMHKRVQKTEIFEVKRATSQHINASQIQINTTAEVRL